MNIRELLYEVPLEKPNLSTDFLRMVRLARECDLVDPVEAAID
jgi:hypothetical protein